jgi:hypothetical protein
VADLLKVPALDQRTDRRRDVVGGHAERHRQRGNIAAEFNRARRFRAGHHGADIRRGAAIALIGVFWVDADERDLQRQARRLLGGALA